MASSLVRAGSAIVTGWILANHNAGIVAFLKPTHVIIMLDL